MRSQTLTPVDLFGNQVRYTVPLFQRPYVWTKGDQWEPLWDDVRTVAERLLHAREVGGVAAESVPHFLGAIVLDQQLVPTGFVQERHIIDGQQRLTTLQLLMDAAHEVVLQYGAETDAAALRNLVLNDPTLTRTPEEAFKVWPTNYDREAFGAAMGDNSSIPSELRDAPVAKAHTYFRERVLEWAEVEGDPDKAKVRLSLLTAALRQHLKLVVIDLEAGDNAQVIFETLNHRGSPLLAADLVKNFIFRQAEADGLDVEALYENSWKRFDSGYWREEIRQGRLTKPRVDIFFNYWLVMRTAREVPADRIFTDFVIYVRAAGVDLGDLVVDLNRHADVFETMYHQFAPHSVEGTFVYRVLRVMEQGVLAPVAMWLFGRPYGSVEDGQIEKALSALESWVTRRMICRRTSQGFNRVVLDMIERLTETDTSRPGDEIEQFLLGLKGESRAWPTDGELTDALSQAQIYRSITRARLRMLLEALEDDRRTPRSEEEYCIRWNLTIEHVMPQGWREHWPLPGNDHESLESSRRDQLVHTLGNLTLVNNRLNPALSNRPWTDREAISRGLGAKGKRSIIDENSVLLLNHEIVQGNPDHWDERSIQARTAALGERFARIWPRPDTPNSTQ